MNTAEYQYLQIIKEILPGNVPASFPIIFKNLIKIFIIITTKK
jgi:hypothetical protein